MFRVLLGLLITTNIHAEGVTGLLSVVNKADGTVSLYDLASGTVQNVPVGRLPHETAIGRGFAFVTNYGSQHIRSSDLSNEPGNTLSVIQLDGNQSVENINLGPARCAPHGIVAAKDGRKVYLTCEGRHEIAVVDLERRQVTDYLPTNQAGSHMLVLSSDETRAYVANFWLGTVSVIDIPNHRLIKQILTGRGSEGIGLSADDRTLLISRVEDNEIVKVDTQTLEVVQRQKLADKHSPIRVIFNPANPGEALVNNVGAGTLQVLNVADLSTVREIKVGRQPIGIAASATHVFVANMKDKTISVVNSKTWQIEQTLKTGAAPDGIAQDLFPGHAA
jgi:YVTN family beta-propeller protein